MLSIVKNFAFLVKYYFEDLLIYRLDVIVKPENVIVKDNRMFVHLILSIFTSFYGIIFLELEATGSVNWRGLWTSNYLYTYQLFPAQLHRQINQLMVVCTFLEVLTLLSYTFVQPVKKKFLLIQTNEQSVSKGGKPLLKSTAIKILTFRRQYKKVLLTTVVTLTLLAIIRFYINVYQNDMYIISVPCLLFYWSLQFPLKVGYFHIGNFCILLFS